MTLKCVALYFLAQDDSERILLLAWNGKGKLAPYSPRWEKFLDDGWTIASLSLERKPSAKEKEKTKEELKAVE